MFATPTVRTLTRYNERKTSSNARKVKHDIMFKKNYLFITVCAKKVVNFFEEKSASLRKICVLRATTKKVVNFFASLNLPPPLEKKSCGRPWLMLMAQPLKHRQSDSDCIAQRPAELFAASRSTLQYTQVKLITQVLHPSHGWSTCVINLSSEVIVWGKMSGGIFWGNLRGVCLRRGFLRREMSGSNVRGNFCGGCPDPHVGLQVSVYSGYDLGHRG